jgi:glyoxylase-like metal-dependent hydrolase (beta-lactamase superfamily II)
MEVRMGETYVSIGGFRCYPLSDGALVYPRETLFPGKSDAELADALSPRPVPEEITLSYAGLLVDTGKQRVLIDTGAGALGPETGHLPENLKACGFTPEQIDVVVVSHLHPDHIGGLMTAEGEPRFANAEVVLSGTEYDYWTSATTQARLKARTLFGLGDLELTIQSWIEKNVTPLADAGKLRMTEGGWEPAPGVMTLPAGGHTPGHLAVLISDGKEELLFGGDAILHPVHVRYPAWKTLFDVMPEQSALTRLQILDRCATDECLTFHFHFPFPCMGRIARWTGGYKWEAAGADGWPVSG